MTDNNSQPSVTKQDWTKAAKLAIRHTFGDRSKKPRKADRRPDEAYLRLVESHTAFGTIIAAAEQYRGMDGKARQSWGMNAAGETLNPETLLGVLTNAETKETQSERRKRLAEWAGSK